MENRRPRKYPSLPKSYKGMFPFKLATTSFIYPDHYIPNVKMLGPYVDEIELLLFESLGPDCLPSRAVIAELGRLAAEFDLSYNVHLPTDISISDPNADRQAAAVETMTRVIDLASPLDPSALILHVPYNENSREDHVVKRWRSRVYQNLIKMTPVVEDRRRIAIETLDYPLELLGEVLDELDLAVCLDLGHLMLFDRDLRAVFEKYAFQTSVLHLHGVENGRDHTTLERLSDKSFNEVLQVLHKFTGVVSIEVFSFENLESSLEFLESQWKQIRDHLREDGEAHGEQKT